MKVFLKILLMGVFFIGFSESKANTLLESLNSAYLNNSKLNAERASMRASREEKREAVSEFLPSSSTMRRMAKDVLRMQQELEVTSKESQYSATLGSRLDRMKNALRKLTPIIGPRSVSGPPLAWGGKRN